MLCPSCAIDLTADQVALGECPHCGSALGPHPSVEEPFAPPAGEQPPVRNPQWDGFQGASLEWEPAVDGEELVSEESFGTTYATGESSPAEPPVSYDSKTVAMPYRGDAEESAPDITYPADAADETSGYQLQSEQGMRPEEIEPRSAQSEFRGSRDRSRDMSHTPPTSDELQTLAREWGDLEGSASAMTVKPSNEGPDAPGRSRSIHDTVESLPRRRVRASGEKLEHPEYELLQMLGEGGMGVVWDARQTSIDRSVAVKMIKGPLSEKVTQRRKFLAEAVVTGDLDHPNIVPIYDVGTDIQGKLFYAMKRVQGTPWLEVFREKTQHENLQILLRVADAVAFAHSRGIIHRDIKPENVMLGGFGEVLLMDWGLALPTREYRKAQSLEFTTGMGGTPAYMAPEMAKGPVERITVASDIYLLGAILYDIITGTAPHAATSVRDCLIAAMRNRIVETDQEGELVDIAMKAMATEPEDRHKSVQEFQQVVREYLSHEESLALASRAHADLENAQQTDDYGDYARAVFGFEEAYELWNGNLDALRGVSAAKLAYARSAHIKGDYDLGLSLLDPARSDHRTLWQQLTVARDESRARQRRLTVAKRVTITTATVAFCLVAGALWFVFQSYKAEQTQRAIAESERVKADQARVEAESQEKMAVLARTKEEEQRKEAESQRALAEEATLEAVAQQKLAVAAQLEAETQRVQAVTARMDADAQRMQAVEARDVAEIARDQAIAARREEEYKAYVAGIGAAAARIDEGAFDVARLILQDLATPRADVAHLEQNAMLANWEWGRLMHLCELYSEQRAENAPIDALAVSPDGSKLATGSRDRLARIQDMASGQVLAELKHNGTFVHSVAWSPDGRFLATGSSDPNGFVQLWDVAAALSGAEQAGQPLDGHTMPVTRVRFSDDGRWLLSCSFDKTARLWDLSEAGRPKLACILEGHNWWVWDGALAPGFAPEKPDSDNRIVTVDQDGLVIVWQLKSGGATVNLDGSEQPLTFRKDRQFLGHAGPVYSVDFARIDGVDWIATGGYDNRVLLWHPDDAQPYTAEAVFEPGQQQAKYRELLGHTNAVQSVSFSDDGRLLVTAGQDNAVWVWDLGASARRYRLRGHSSEVRSAVITPDGQHVVSAGLDEQILVWSTEGEQEFKILQDQQFSRHEDAVLSSRFSSDGSQVLTASTDRTARLWDVKTSARTAELRQGHAFLVSGAALFPDGQTLATAAADDSVRVWDIRSGAERHVLLQTGRNGIVALSHDENWLLTGGPDNTAKLWPAAAMRADAAGTLEPATLAGHGADVTAAACSPVANLAVTGDVNGRTVLWNLETREAVWNVRLHNRRINAVQFAPDGSSVFIGSSDNLLNRVDVATGKEIGRLTTASSVRSFGITSDGARVIVAEELNSDTETPTSTLIVWDLSTQQEVRRIGPFNLGVQSLLIAPDNQTVLLAGRDNTVRRIPTNDEAAGLPAPFVSVDALYGGLAAAVLSQDGQTLLTMNGADARLFDANTGHELLAFRPQDALADAEFSPDGQWIITASWDGTVRIWNAAQQPPETVATLNAHDDFVNSAVFSPDGKQILTSSDDATARLWDAQTRVLVHEFKGHGGPVNQAIFSPDGTLVLTVSDDFTARLWDARTGQPVGAAFQDGHTRPILCGAFSKDGKRIATGSDDTQVVLWDVNRRAPLAILGGHTAAITAVAFSPDDARVFTASRDRTAKVWDVSPAGLEFAELVSGGAANQQIARAFDLLTLTGHAREVTSLAISSDGRKLLTGSRDRTAIIWSTADWTKAAAPAGQPVAQHPATVSAGQP